MQFILRVLLGFAISGVGYLVVWKTQTVVGWIGLSAWAEWHLAGFGGTTGMYKIIGIVVILIGFLVITGGYASILEGFAGLFVR